MGIPIESLARKDRFDAVVAHDLYSVGQDLAQRHEVSLLFSPPPSLPYE